MNSTTESRQDEAVVVSADCCAPLKDQQQEMDEDLKEASEVFNSLFSTRKPKDGWAGLSSGLKSVTKGTIAGKKYSYDA